MVRELQVPSTLGYETIKVGGVVAPRQIITAGDKTTNRGDGHNSGLLGLAFPDYIGPSWKSC